ncbi:hypothetical protein BYT27DRAFT_7249267 [Phlegmacium glaucopus]|nr:hypothetical protein BYT27DRAFT_7249267 [Phlegmacium glaucopus]
MAQTSTDNQAKVAVLDGLCGVQESMLDSTELKLAKTIFNLQGDGSKNEDERAAPRCNTLHLALAVSPLYLLMPIQLLKALVGWKRLLNTFYALGNDKSSVLLSIEKAIWKVVFWLVVGEVDPDVATNKRWFKMDDSVIEEGEIVMVGDFVGSGSNSLGQVMSSEVREERSNEVDMWELGTGVNDDEGEEGKLDVEDEGIESGDWVEELDGEESAGKEQGDKVEVGGSMGVEVEEDVNQDRGIVESSLGEARNGVEESKELDGGESAGEEQGDEMVMNVDQDGDKMVVDVEEDEEKLPDPPHLPPFHAATPAPSPHDIQAQPCWPSVLQVQVLQ